MLGSHVSCVPATQETAQGCGAQAIWRTSCPGIRFEFMLAPNQTWTLGPRTSATVIWTSGHCWNGLSRLTTNSSSFTKTKYIILGNHLYNHLNISNFSLISKIFVLFFKVRIKLKSSLILSIFKLISQLALDQNLPGPNLESLVPLKDLLTLEWNSECPLYCRFSAAKLPRQPSQPCQSQS